MRFVALRPRPFIHGGLRHARQYGAECAYLLLVYSPEACMAKNRRSQHAAPCVVADLAWQRIALCTKVRDLEGLALENM